MKLHFIHDWSKWSDTETLKIKKKVPDWERKYLETTFTPPQAMEPFLWIYKGEKEIEITIKLQKRRCLVCNIQQEREFE